MIAPVETYQKHQEKIQTLSDQVNNTIGHLTTNRQLGALLAIATDPGINQVEIAQQIKSAPAQARKIVAHLRKIGWVHAESDVISKETEDGPQWMRVMLHYLTEAGRDFLFGLFEEGGSHE